MLSVATPPGSGPAPGRGPVHKLRRMPSMHNLGITRKKVPDQPCFLHPDPTKGGAAASTASRHRLKPLTPSLRQPCSPRTRSPSHMSKSSSFTDLHFSSSTSAAASASSIHYSHIHAGVELGDPVLPPSFVHFAYCNSDEASEARDSLHLTTATARPLAPQVAAVQLQPAKPSSTSTSVQRRRSKTVSSTSTSTAPKLIRRKPPPSLNTADIDSPSHRHRHPRDENQAAGSPVSLAESSLYPASTPSTIGIGVCGGIGRTLALPSEISLLASSSSRTTGTGTDTPQSSCASLPASLKAAVAAAPAVPAAAAAVSEEQPLGIVLSPSTPAISKQPSRRSLILAENTFYLPPIHRKPALRAQVDPPSPPAVLRKPSSFHLGICVSPIGHEHERGEPVGVGVGLGVGLSDSLRTFFTGSRSREPSRELSTVFKADANAERAELHRKRKAATLPRDPRTGAYAISQPVAIYPYPATTRTGTSTMAKNEDANGAGGDKAWRHSLLHQAVNHSLRAPTSTPTLAPHRPKRQRPRIPSGLTPSPVPWLAALEPISPSLSLSEAELAARREIEGQDDGGLVIEDEAAPVAGRAMTPWAHPLPPPPRSRTSSRRVSGVESKAAAVSVRVGTVDDVSSMPGAAFSTVSRESSLRKVRRPPSLPLAPSGESQGQGSLQVLVSSAETSLETLCLALAPTAISKAAG